MTSKSRKKMMLTGLAAAVVLPLSQVHASDYCSGEPEVSNVTLMADWLPWASQGPMIAAQLNGYYEEEGLTLELMAPANPADPIRLVAANRVNFSLTYVPEVMMAREEGIPVRSIAATMRVLSSGLFFKGEADIDDASDLAGKTLGVGPKQDAQAFLNTVLDGAGLTRSDVTVVDPGFGAKELVMTGRIDAAHGLTMAEGMVFSDEREAAGHDPAGWIMYTDFGVPSFYYQLLVGNDTWVENHPATTCRFLRATARGLDSWKADGTPVTDSLSTSTSQFTRPQHAKMYDKTIDHWFSEDGTPFVQDEAVWAEARDWALERGLIRTGQPATEYFTNDFVVN